MASFNSQTGTLSNNMPVGYYEQGQPQASGFDWGNLLSGLAGVGGTLYANHQASAGANNATNLAQFKGVNLGTPGGMVSGQNNGGQLNYAVNSPLTQNANQFQGLSTAYGNNAASGANGNPYLSAANNTLNQFSQFDPQQFANQQYQNMSALAAPGNTDQTQAMLNYEQATGRGGLTQNGQLGDLGGLQLAQSTADNQRRLQAQQLGMQQQNTLATNAQNLLQSGLGMNSSNLSNSLAANQGSLGINQQLMQLLQTAMGGQAAQANAGANAAKYQYQNGVNQANSTGNLLGGLLQGSQTGGSSGLSGLVNTGKNLYNGYQSLFGGGGYGASASTLGSLGSDLGASTGSMLSGTAGDVAAANDAWLGGGGFGGFSSAGGGAAGAAGAGAAGAGAGLGAGMGLADVTGSLGAGLDAAAASSSAAVGGSAAAEGGAAASGGLGSGLAAAAPWALAALAIAAPFYGATTAPVQLGAKYIDGLKADLTQPKDSQAFQNAYWELSAGLSNNPKQYPAEIKQLAASLGIRPLAETLKVPGYAKQASIMNQRFVKQS